MNILFLGDVVGKTGRTALKTHLPKLKKRYKPHCTIVNGENAAHGFGINKTIAQELHDIGADVITLGNHTWDQKAFLDDIKFFPRVIRPLNMIWHKAPGFGVCTLTAGDKNIIIINALGNLSMDQAHNPFQAIDAVLETQKLGKTADAIVVDFHAELTAEKMAMGHYLDGRVSLVVGTHTHIPTADAQILPNGTAYQTDAGMCGDFDTVIGMNKHAAISRFLGHVPRQKLEPGLSPATICGVYIRTDDQSGLATHIEPIRVGGRLACQTGS
jgi:metallophosphoesterase (TIGR00282 family)